MVSHWVMLFVDLNRNGLPDMYIGSSRAVASNFHKLLPNNLSLGLSLIRFDNVKTSGVRKLVRGWHSWLVAK
jgi:hypothetical protein